MSTIVDSLAGKKTYIVAVVVAVVGLLNAYGVFSPSQLQVVNEVLGALGLAALRAGVASTK